MQAENISPGNTDATPQATGKNSKSADPLAAALRANLQRRKAAQTADKRK